MKNRINIILLIAVFISAISLTSCNKGTGNSHSDALASNIDTSVNPGKDFFSYANGKWILKNPIPASEPSNGIWQLIGDTINAQVRKICESSAAIANPEMGGNKQKIGDFYSSGMDSTTLNKKGISDLQPLFDKINNAKTTDDIISLVAWMNTIGSSPFFSFYIAQDDKNSAKYSIFLRQGGLNLPERSFYFDTDSRSVQIREEYVKHLTKMFRIMGYDDTKASKAAYQQMKLETALASSSRKIEDLRDPFLNYNKLSFKQLTAQTPAINWEEYVKGTGLTTIDSIIVGQPEFFIALNGYLKNSSIEVLKDYLKYDLLSSSSEYLDDQTRMETFHFYYTVLDGIETPKPRWYRVVDQTNGYLGELIGQVYVTEYLPAGTKEKLLEIGNAVRDVYAERIKALDWMSEATREKALRKLNGISMKVGYPDKWKDMSSVNINRSSFLENVINVNRWHFNYMISRYGRPVDRTEWMMEPQTYNAYYDPSNNEICVPGCNIIVPGYERKMADDAILYAIIGASTFGHEMTHGFDDQGSKYDEKGNLKTWWTKEDSTRFYSKTKLIVNQFNEYNPVDNLHINGEATQGENIADLGGIMMGYQAFQKTEQYNSNKKIAGLTPDQRFFLGFAYAWLINARPESISNQVKSDVHSPAKYRVIGTLSNVPEFYKAFDVKEGDFMWRPDSLRVKIW
jgi:putative endopeptidase